MGDIPLQCWLYLSPINSWPHMVNSKYCQVQSYTFMLWMCYEMREEKRGERKTQPQISGSREDILAYIHMMISFQTLSRNQSKSTIPNSPSDKTHRHPPSIYPRLLPVSAAGCSESCCPVIRCRQTCWELWRLAWSMLEKKNKGRHQGSHKDCQGLLKH